MKIKDLDPDVRETIRLLIALVWELHLYPGPLVPEALERFRYLADTFGVPLEEE
jgi:hypothetical protein